MSKRKRSYLTVSDNFCGAGGNSIAARLLNEELRGGLEITVARNHWRRACETYQTNFPNAQVVCADLQHLDPSTQLATDIHFSSPSCQRHSKASGLKRTHQRQQMLFDDTPAKPEDIRSRETMMCVPHYAEAHGYNVIIVENVVDVHDWAGYDAWRMYMDALGYRCQPCYFNSMFFPPCPQSRDRVYFVFTKKKNKKPDLDYRPQAWCTRCERDNESVQRFKPGHSPKATYGEQYDYRCTVCGTEVVPYYYAAFNAIDWSIPAERIGDRKRPLVPNTMRRIEHGWKKYGNRPLILKNMHGSGLDCRVREAARSALFSLHAKNGISVVMPWLTDSGFEYNQPGQHSSTSEAFRSFTTGQTRSIVAPPGFLTTQRGTSEAHLRAGSFGLDEALTTISAGGIHHGLVTSSTFVSAYYGASDVNLGIDQALPTFRTKQSHALVNVPNAPRSIEDLHYRMLRSREHQAGMSFPMDYVITGNEEEKVKQLGNAVTPPPQVWILKRCIETLM